MTSNTVETKETTNSRPIDAFDRPPFCSFLGHQIATSSLIDQNFNDFDGTCNGSYHEHFGILYNELGILDSKASSLMAFNAIGLAVLAIWLGTTPANVFHLVLDFVFLAVLWSSLLCLRVVNLIWRPRKPSGNQRLDCKNLRELHEARANRTAWYKAAWALAREAVIVILVVSIVHIVEVTIRATGTCGTFCESAFSSEILGSVPLINSSH